MSRGLRHLWLVLLAAAVVAVLLFRSRGAIGLEDFSWHRLGAVLGEARPGGLLASVVAIYAAYAVRALRWMRFSRYLGRTRFASLYAATLVGFAAVFLLGRAGEPIRPLLIARKERVPVSSAFGIYVLERVFDVASTVVIAGLALLVFAPATLRGRASETLLTTARTTGTALLVGLVAMVAFLVYFRWHGAGVLGRRLESWGRRPGWRARAAGLFAGFSEGLQAIRTVGDLLAALAYTAAHWLLVVLIYLWVPRSFGGRLGELGLSAALLVLAFTMVGSTLQLPGVGGGSQLAGFLAFTAMFGVEKEPAAAAAILLWLITFAVSSLAGIPLLIREGWSMGELRRLARAEREAEAAGTHVSLASGGDPAGESPR